VCVCVCVCTHICVCLCVCVHVYMYHLSKNSFDQWFYLQVTILIMITVVFSRVMRDHLFNAEKCQYIQSEGRDTCHEFWVSVKKG
jgi:SNF family Na+-dependent transporter